MKAFNVLLKAIGRRAAEQFGLLMPCVGIGFLKAQTMNTGRTVAGDPEATAQVTTANERLKDLFSRALEKGSEGREQFLAGACKDEPELRLQVESLLNAHERAGGFLAGTPRLSLTETAPGPGGGQAADKTRPFTGIRPPREG